MITRDQVQGHWVRHWIKAPGFEDRTTRVHWLQVGWDYADLRIPLDRPDLSGVEALSDLPARDLLILAQAEGFAGHITLDGSTCTWHRQINWHGTPEGLDAGTLAFDAQGRLIETGIHSTYSELWSHRSAEVRHAIRLHGDGFDGFLVQVGEVAAIGIGAPDTPSTAPIRAALADGHVPEGVGTLFDGLHVIGHWAGDTLVAELATQPFAEGGPVLTKNGTSYTWHRIGFTSARSDIVLQARTTA